MRVKLLHGNKYIIRHKNKSREFEAVYLREYETLFSETYKKVFLDKNGNLYSIEGLEYFRLKK